MRDPLSNSNIGWCKCDDVFTPLDGLATLVEECNELPLLDSWWSA